MNVLELAKEIAPGILTSLVIVFLLWVITRFKKIIKLLDQIPEMKCDIKETKLLSMYQFKRLDAQDGATVELFRALQNGIVNGEAARAITIMTEAKDESALFIQRLFFEDKCTKKNDMKKEGA